MKLAWSDFGESKALSTRNKALTCRGTPTWMAPEVLMSCNQREYTLKADIYSFGMLIFELMTLETPYKGVGMFDTSKSIIMGKLPKLTNDANVLYPNVVDLWRKMVSYDPNERPDANEVFDILNTLKND